MTNDDVFMRRCIELAANGLGFVAPNPLVGSVICKDGQIIGEGYHRRFGEPHAEVNAVHSVSSNSLLAGSTLYVNLEPCAHQGKTPPCTNLIIEKKISRVVIGCIDPYHEVSGKGIAILRAHGINVLVGVEKEKAIHLNRRFFTFHNKNRPYVILKWAQTADGFIDAERLPGTAARPAWITSEKLRMLVHKWRSEEMAIMVGTRTALLDNPTLNVRNWHGNQPIRIVIDKKCSLPLSLNIFKGSQKTIVYNHCTNRETENLLWVKVPNDRPMLPYILNHLHTIGIQSVFVEGGRTLLQSFIDESLFDEARIFVGPQFFGNGCKAPTVGRFSPAQVIIGNENFFWMTS